MTRTFHKMHGLGNDFVIFDAREEPLSIDEPLARAISDRKTGIGCDQLILLEPSSVADLKMRIWNHDGLEVESCGNASRCVVALTHAKTIETGGGMVTGTEEGSDIEVSLGEPRFEWDQVPITYAFGSTLLDITTAENVARAHTEGYAWQNWFGDGDPDAPATWRKLIDMCVDGTMTSHPRAYEKVLRAHKRPSSCR